MIVGNDVSVFIDNKSGTQTALFEIPILIFIEKTVKKVSHGVIIAKRAFLKMTKYPAAALDGLDRSDVDHGLTRLFGKVGKTFRR